MYDKLRSLSPELQKHFRHLVEELRTQEFETMLAFIRDSRQALLAARTSFQNTRRPQGNTSRGQSPLQHNGTLTSGSTPDLNGSIGSISLRPDSAGSGEFLQPRARSAVRTPSDIEMFNGVETGTPSTVGERNNTRRPASSNESRPGIYRETTEEVILNMRIASAKMENDRARQSEITKSMIDKRKDQQNRRLEELFNQAQDVERKQQEQKERQREQTLNAIEEKKRQR